MIRFEEIVADAYVSGGRNIAVPSTPGRQVRFLAGHAAIKDGRDMVAMMRLPMVKLVLTPYAMSWWSEWVAQAGQIKAEILRPQPPEPEPPPVDDSTPAGAWDPNLRPDGTASPEPGT